MKIKPLDHTAALELRFDSDAGENLTIRDYLHALLWTLWLQGEGFSGKRPFGNSGWESDIYLPLIKAGYLKGKTDSDGYGYDVDEHEASHMVKQLIYFAFYGKIPPLETEDDHDE